MNRNSDNEFERLVASSVSLGKVLRPHGMKGEVRVYLYGVDPALLERMARKDFFLLQHTTQTFIPVSIETLRFHQNVALLKFTGIDNRFMAEDIRGFDLSIRESDLPKLDADEYYYEDLVGLTVRDVDTDESIGKVVKIITAGGAETLEIDSGDSKFLLPFVKAFIKEVNLEQGYILAQIPPGIKEL